MFGERPRTLEIDQLAAYSLADPARREALLRRVPAFAAPLRSLVENVEKFSVQSTLHRGMPNYEYTYVPTMLFHGQSERLGEVIKLGVIENKMRVDARGIFFTVGDFSWAFSCATDYSGQKSFLPKDAAVFAVSPFTSNSWSSQQKLDIVEDLHRIYRDPDMRVYVRGLGQNDIPVSDIDHIIISRRSEADVDRLIREAPHSLRSQIKNKILMIDYEEGDISQKIRAVTSFSASHGWDNPMNNTVLWDVPEIFFWEMQRTWDSMPLNDSLLYHRIREVMPSAISALRDVVRIDPSFWGKSGDELFDPVGIIRYEAVKYPSPS